MTSRRILSWAWWRIRRLLGLTSESETEKYRRLALEWIRELSRKGVLVMPNPMPAVVYVDPRGTPEAREVENTIARWARTTAPTLDVRARELFGVERQDGESDDELRARVQDRLDSIRPVVRELAGTISTMVRIDDPIHPSLRGQASGPFTRPMGPADPGPITWRDAKLVLDGVELDTEALSWRGVPVPEPEPPPRTAWDRLMGR